MSRTVIIEIYNVNSDGFPPKKGGAVGFIWDGDVYTGWPLIDDDGDYPDNDSLVTSAVAKADPGNVKWEASEECVRGVFVGVTHWFQIKHFTR